MKTEEEKIREIKQMFLGYARENELSAFNTPHYFAKQILPDVSFFLKMKVIGDLIKFGVMQMSNKISKSLQWNPYS